MTPEERARDFLIGRALPGWADVMTQDLAAVIRAAVSAAIDRGQIWAAIRSELSNCCAQMWHAATAESYEVESVHLDTLARKLADAVCKRLGKEETPHA